MCELFGSPKIAPAIILQGETFLSKVSEIYRFIMKISQEKTFRTLSRFYTDSRSFILQKPKFIGPLQKICLGQKELSFVAKSTCLGIQIDNKLSWSPHIKSLSKRFSARVKKLKHLKGLDSRILESIYFKGIIPSITYSIALWGSSKSLQTLEDIHIGAARFIFNIKNSTLSTRT